MVELAYTLFTDGPDEALNPVMLGVAAALLVQLGKVEAFDARQAVAALSYVAALAGLFTTRKWLAEPERPFDWSPVTAWRIHRRKRRLKHRLLAERWAAQRAEAPNARRDEEATVVSIAKPERGASLQPLSREVLVRRSLELSPTGYLTIISIIQGVALALLAQQAIANISLLVGAQAIAVLSILVFVFYFYTVMTVLLRWPPSILDALLPFIVGCLEIPPAFFLGRSLPWSACVGAFLAAALAGLEVTKRYSAASQFGANKEAHDIHLRMLTNAMVIVAPAMLGVLACGFMARYGPGPQVFWGVGAAVVTIAALGATVTRMEYSLSEIYGTFGVPRPTFS